MIVWLLLGLVLGAIFVGYARSRNDGGPGTLIAPRAYPLACLSFDLLVATAVVAGFRSRPVTRAES